MKWLFLLSLLLPGAHASASGSPASLLAPLLIGSESLGEIWVYPGRSSEDLQLGADSFSAVLDLALEPNAAMELKKQLIGRTLVSKSWLESKDIRVSFDETQLVVKLELPDELRKRRSLKVRRSWQGGERETLGPAPFSGYVNGTASQSFLYPKAKSRQPFGASLSGAMNLKDFVLEGGETFTENQEHEWTRDDTRLVRDFESILVRAQAGDLQLNTTGYQNARPMGGLALSRQHSIQPYASIRPLHRTEIHLSRPATIEVYVNGDFVNRLSAPAGPVNLEDFPLFSGLNEVRLKITDDTGRVEWVDLNLLYDVQLLGRGKQQFAYQAGAPSRRYRRDRVYDSKNAAFSGYHRLGLTDRFTLGANLQVDRNIVMGGGDLTFLTPAGLFTLEGAASDRGSSFDGQAARLRYRTLDYKKGNDRPLRVAAEAEFRSAWFSGLAELFNYNEFSWKYDLHASSPLSATASLGAGFIFEKNRGGSSDRRSWRSDLSAQLARQWRASLAYSLVSAKDTEHRIQLNVNWLAESGKHYGNFSYDYPAKKIRAEATRNASSVVDDYRATAGIENSPERGTADALIEYTHEKAVLRLEHASRYHRDVPGIRTTTHTTGLRLSSALAWAGSSFAWTRPIYDSFAILTARPTLRPFSIPVNPVGESFEAHINRAGPAVLPALSAYNESPATLNTSTLPAGYSAGREFYLLRPTYRSGIEIEVGADSTAVVVGKLLLPKGEPYSLGTGKVGHQEFFTNREGQFVLEGLAPGSYEMIPDKDGLTPFRFNLGPDKVGIVRLAPHTFERSPE